MGLQIDVSPKLTIELRRESYILIPLEDESGENASEMHYDTVFALEAAVQEIKRSERFQTWLKKKEGQ